jgi:hypothetical protein
MRFRAAAPSPQRNPPPEPLQRSAQCLGGLRGRQLYCHPRFSLNLDRVLLSDHFTPHLFHGPHSFSFDLLLVTAHNAHPRDVSTGASKPRAASVDRVPRRACARDRGSDKRAGPQMPRPHPPGRFRLVPGLWGAWAWSWSVPFGVPARRGLRCLPPVWECTAARPQRSPGSPGCSRVWCVSSELRSVFISDADDELLATGALHSVAIPDRSFTG